MLRSFILTENPLAFKILLLSELRQCNIIQNKSNEALSKQLGSFLTSGKKSRVASPSHSQLTRLIFYKKFNKQYPLTLP